jgi:hypothetical protein
MIYLILTLYINNPPPPGVLDEDKRVYIYIPSINSHLEGVS